jgi:hypothetical protein
MARANLKTNPLTELKKLNKKLKAMAERMDRENVILRAELKKTAKA